MIAKIVCAVIFSPLYIFGYLCVTDEEFISPDKTFTVQFNYHPAQIVIQNNDASVALHRPFDTSCFSTCLKISSSSNYIVVGYSNSGLAIWQRNNNVWQLYRLLHREQVENLVGVPNVICPEIILMNEIDMIITANEQGELLIWELIDGEYQLCVAQVAQEEIRHLIDKPNDIMKCGLLHPYQTGKKLALE